MENNEPTPEDKCEKSEDGAHEMFLKDNKLVLRRDPMLGVVANVYCKLCGKTGAVRLHWEEVDWDEPEQPTE